ncbi:nicotinate phosphoribosyltransferase [Rubrivivax gelatinosus]|uniref:Nicotinate phosphoribosyltransferase n=1 Tax=Rubrivivax gelatinosus TaxID=28068 RepID=A0A4R2LYY5_RUBGE|nr:nicotinate phosphoribosyltransferase [Rubrivivax gelatinosus]MBK1690064.1 nicotinate phosphoribosyltransferase [Rubrivivax gelatinosus]TCO96906.1 nicotinate phosphoribosyltransferase [Rubrivivax gelatinosus]
MTPIFTSLLETDLYKFSMWQAMLHRHPATQARYRFVCRNQTAFPLAELVSELEREIEALCALSFRADELAYLRTLRYLSPDFIDFLRIFRFQKDFVRIGTDGPNLSISVDGPQVHVMAFEIFVLAIVNELYFRRVAGPDALGEGRRRLAAKIERLREFATEPPRRHPFRFFDFGLRRRFSGAWHREVLTTLKQELPEFFTGTSNVLLARELELVPIGTMAHEYLQTFQGLGVRLRDHQKAALEAWVQEYRGDLGTALTDVVGMDAFLSDFDLYFAKLFDGIRHDSGDPYVWGEKALAHYAKLRIDPATKRLVFSDALDIDRCLNLYRHFADRTQCGFGIGTHLSNDTGLRTLNIVMKLVSVNGQPVAKISDAPGKTMCDDEGFLAYLRQVFGVPGN